MEAARILRRQADAEDVVQEALARAWRSRASCRTPDAPEAWCLQITRNEALRLISRSRSVSTAEPLDAGSEVCDDRALGERDRALARVDIVRALGELAPRERLLIALRYAHDCSHPEIAEKLGISEATARVRLHRAHKRLRALLESCG